MTTTRPIENPALVSIQESSGTTHQTISMDLDTNARLHRLYNTDPSIRSISSYICGLIRRDLDQRGVNLDGCDNIRYAKRTISRFELVKHIIFPKLYDLANDNPFPYKIFCKYMAEPPISVIRECTVRDYMQRMIALGYIISLQDEVSYRPRKRFEPNSRFQLSKDLIKAEGRLEGLQ